MKTENIQKLENFFGDLYRNQEHGESSVNDFITWSDQDADELTFEWLTDYLREQTGFFEIGVIYYSNAMKYLSEYDASLQCSLEIASDLGFSIRDLNSETLASLLKSQNFEAEWYESQSDIDNLFDEIREAEDLCDE